MQGERGRNREQRAWTINCRDSYRIFRWGGGRGEEILWSLKTDKEGIKASY